MVFSLSLEKGRAVLYSDFVTILRGAPMQYINKLATSQKTESPVLPPPKYTVMYPVHTRVQTVKIPPIQK